MQCFAQNDAHHFHALLQLPIIKVAKLFEVALIINQVNTFCVVSSSTVKSLKESDQRVESVRDNLTCLSRAIGSLVQDNVSAAQLLLALCTQVCVSYM